MQTHCQLNTFELLPCTEALRVVDGLTAVQEHRVQTLAVQCFQAALHGSVWVVPIKCVDLEQNKMAADDSRVLYLDCHQRFVLAISKHTLQGLQVVVGVFRTH